MNYTIDGLAAALRGKKIACAFTGPYIKNGDFESCQAFVRFDDDSILSLDMVDVSGFVEYPLVGGNLEACVRIDAVDGLFLAGLSVVGLFFSETIFSIGLVVMARGLGVLCLDTKVAFRMGFYLYSIECTACEGGCVYLSESSGGLSVMSVSAFIKRLS